MEESGIDNPLKGSKQGSEEQDLKREPNHVHDRISNESDGSNWQMDKLDGPPWVELQMYWLGSAATESAGTYSE